MKKFIFAFLFITLISFACSLEMKQTTTDVAVIPEFNQPGVINLQISDAIPGSYNLFTLTAVRLEPETKFELLSGNNSLDVYVYPTTDLVAYGPSTYSFAYSIRRHLDDEITNGKMAVRVVSISEALAISSDSNSPDAEEITFYVKNRESIDLKNITVKFSSIFFETEQTFDIGANEKKEFSIPISKDKLSKIEAGSYLVKADVQTDRGSRVVEGRIYLDEKQGITVEDFNSGFLIRSNHLIKTNSGNVVESSVVITTTRNFITRLFTHFNVNPDKVERNGATITYLWERKLSPAERFEVIATTNYLLPFVVILAIALLIIGFKRYLETKVEIEKSVTPVKTKTGVYALRVKLHVRAKKSVTNLSIIDKIPGVVQVYEKFDSPIKPTKVDAKNKRLQWDLGDLSADEERFFNYVVYSTVGVVGKFALPAALAVFEKDGKIHEVESGSVFFLTEQITKGN